MKPRSFHRLARLYSWIAHRERAAWERATRSDTIEESQRLFARAERWMLLMLAVTECRRTEEAT